MTIIILFIFKYLLSWRTPFDQVKSLINIFVNFQVSYQPSSHAVIARPDYSSNGGEASVGAALSVSDSGSNPDPYNQDLLALLGQPPVRQTEEPRQQLYSQPQQQHLQQVQQTSNVQSVAPQYQQVSMNP